MDIFQRTILPASSTLTNGEYLDLSHYTRPGDPDSAPGIRQAVLEAKKTGIDRIIFEAGRYVLKSKIIHSTDGIIHDAGSKDVAPQKECHILISGIDGLTLCGAVDDTGRPATVLVGWNDGKNHSFLPAILWCEHNPNLELVNLAFTREPAYTSAGLITDKNAESVIVEVLPDCPIWDDMGAYCTNRFSPNGERLIGESVTYGLGAKTNWKHIGQNRLKLHDSRIAGILNCGELLSWHQGAQTDFQVYIGQCDNLRLTNLRTYNSNGFCMLTESCRNINAKSVHFSPDGNRLFTGPRDAWKIFKCSGDINVEDFQVTGVRMDGQNIHSNWLYLKEGISANEAIFFCKYTYAPIRTGSIIEFYDGISIQTRIVDTASLESKETVGHRGHLYRVRFSRNMPNFAREECMCAARCWEADQYSCTNSVFVNIAGAGHLVRYDCVELRNNRYRNIMNPGILLGAELPTHAEAGHVSDILITQCEFDNCGFFPRYGASGCIGVQSSGFSLPLNHDIKITENSFSNSEIAIDLKTAREVKIWNNHYQSIERKIRIEAETTHSISFLDD